ncbi:alpha/beta-hydrolase [Artomyces pyxidatus]|uniref:Alpha/beta-hydrolase n=1 Tax=Artomyces pyxidatus TaxID=48021 RepID=A0ACB8SQ77_9AGAM|nr:alpha/beta-hydrolase [Artomyces pyxidatus]
MRLSYLFTTVFLYTGHAALASPPNIVDLGYASYLGNQSFPNTVAYLGIPYAEPPLGGLRFRAPLPLNTTRVTVSTGNNVVDATQYPDFCIQGSVSGKPILHRGAGSEDCLKVNIYAPAGAIPGDNLPVLVYIHGGGYVYGNPRNWPFDHWIHQSPNVVIVSVYYRLDAFGFLAVPDFSDPTNGDFNAGYQDQIQALKWVQKYISAFGGDPKQVTINGESAGGSSVELHLVDHESEQLFARAIAQSVYRAPLPTPAQQKPLFEFFAAFVGCNSSSVPQQLSCLREAPVSMLARAQDNASNGAFQGPYNAFHPVQDGQLIRDHPTSSILKGQFRAVPLIVGSTSNETLSGGTDIGASLEQFFPNLSNASIEKLLQVYPADEFENGDQRYRVVTGESELICARTIMGEAWAEHGPTFTYRYNQADPTSSDPTVVGHAAENYMMFLGTETGNNGSTTFYPMNATQIAFAEELIAYWLSFVRSGDPNTYKLSRSPLWVPFTLGSKRRIVLQEGPPASNNVSGSYIEAEPEQENARCHFVAGRVDGEQN